MTDRELSILWQIAATARDNKKLRAMTQDDFAKWVSKQLALMKIYTAPRGASYVTNASQEQCNKYLSGGPQ